MKSLILLTLFVLVLRAADASEDESKNSDGFRNDGTMNRPIYPFEAFNMGFDQFFKNLPPPLLAAMNRNGPTVESYERTETEKHHYSKSDSETGTQETKSMSLADTGPAETEMSTEAVIESIAGTYPSSSDAQSSASESKSSSEAVIESIVSTHPSSSDAQSSSSESKSSSESVDYIPRFVLDALGFFSPGAWDSESESLHASLSTVDDESEFSVPDRDSLQSRKKPFFVSRSKHDSLEFNQEVSPEETQARGPDDEMKSTDSRIENTNDGIVEGFEVTAGEQTSQAESSSRTDEKPTPEAGRWVHPVLHVYPGEESAGSRDGGSGSKSSMCTESKECESGVVVDSVASESISRTRLEQNDDAGSLSTVSIALEEDGTAGFDSMALQETCYEGAAYIDSSNAKEVEVENSPQDVLNLEKARHEKSIQNVRKRLEDGFNHLNEIKKKLMKKTNVLGDLNHVIADLEYLCDNICEEIPDKYLDSDSF